MIQISCKVSLNWIGWFPSCHKFACLLWLKVQELSNLIVPPIHIWIVIFQINNYFLSPVMLSLLAEQSTTLSLVVWNVQLKCIFNALWDGRITFNINVDMLFRHNGVVSPWLQPLATYLHLIYLIFYRSAQMKWGSGILRKLALSLCPKPVLRRE